MMILTVTGSYAYKREDGIFVLSEFSGMGIGTDLMNALITKAYLYDVNYIDFDTYKESNEYPYKFHVNLGASGNELIPMSYDVPQVMAKRLEKNK